MKKGWLVYDKIGAKRNAWFISELISYGKIKNLSLELVLCEDLLFGIEKGEPFIDKELPSFVLMRAIMPELSAILESLSVPVFNNAECSRIFNDKWETHFTLAKRGIPMSKTFFENKRTFQPEKYVYPLIMKAPDGHGGSEVFKIENEAEAEHFSKYMRNDRFILQNMETPSLDIRVYLLNSKILKSVKRTSTGDFKSNFSLGGSAEVTEITEEMEEIVFKVDALFHPTFVGVDFIFDKEGNPLLNEIEDVVGTRMLYALTDLKPHELLLDTVSKYL